MRRSPSALAFLAVVVAGCTQSGRVVDATNGRPLPGVEVVARNRPFEVGRMETDAAGRFSVFAPVHATTFTLSKPGYSDQYMNRREFFSILRNEFRMQRR